MKRIKIFLASSITDLRLDRLEVGDFIRQLNEIYFDRGVQFSLAKCEDFDNAIRAEGKQSAFDEEIKASELCFFLFFKKVGDYTRHEFEVALDAFQTAQKPKIVTYFKYVNSPDEAEGDVKAFMHMLDSEVKHYYNIYQNIDTLKLGILMQIKLMGLDAEEPKVEGGKIVFGGQTIAETNALPVFTGNSSLGALKEEYKALTEQYFALREKLMSDAPDEAAEEEYRKVASKRAAAEKGIRDAEKAVLEAVKSMAERTAKGNLSPRQVAAYRAFEKGKYKDALEILDLNEILAELSHSEQMAEGYKERIQTNVNELLQRIEALKAEGLTEESFAEIGKIYEEACARVEKFDLDKDPLYDYAIYCDVRHEHEKALGLAKRLLYYRSSPLMSLPEFKFGNVYNLLGVTYFHLGRYEEAEAEFRKANAIYLKLHAEDPAPYDFDLAVTYCNLGRAMGRLGKYEEAERMLIKSLEIREGMLPRNPAFCLDVASSCAFLAELYFGMGRFEEAEEVCRKWLTACGPVKDEYSTAYLLNEARAYRYLGKVYGATNRPHEAEEAYLSSVERFEWLGEALPTMHAPALAEIYKEVAIFYEKQQRFDEAAKAYSSAIEVYGRLESECPEKCEYAMDLAECGNQLGNLYSNAKNFEEAVKAYRLAAENLYRNAKTPNAELRLSLTLANLGDTYHCMEQYDKATEVHRHTFEYAKKFPQDERCAKIVSCLKPFFEGEE